MSCLLSTTPSLLSAVVANLPVRSAATSPSSSFLPYHREAAYTLLGTPRAHTTITSPQERADHLQRILDEVLALVDDEDEMEDSTSTSDE